MIYCYACKCGYKLEKKCSISEFQEFIKCTECGGLMGINIAAQQQGVKDTASNWPMASDALGVHPDQAKEYSDYLRSKGVPTEINSDGNPVLTSQRHRKNVCAATQMYDRNAGYGDAAPKHNLRKRGSGKRRFRHAG